MNNQQPVPEKNSGLSWNALDWLRLYKSVTDKDVIAENKRRADRIVRAEEKKLDTGL